MSKVRKVSISLGGLAFWVFVFLKLAGVLTCSWWWLLLIVVLA